MNILTYFDAKKISDGWRTRVEEVFSRVPNAKVTHVDTLEGVSPRAGQIEHDVIVFGFSDGKEGLWTQIFPHIRERQIPILLTGDLDKEFYRRIFREHTGHPLETLDTVQFYVEAPSLLQRIEEKYTRHMGERKE